MAFLRRCPKCGLDFTDASATTCPTCGAPLVAPLNRARWIGALVQITLSTIFMLLFGFPRVMIVVFAAAILIGTAFSKLRAATRPALQKPLSHPVLFRIVSIGIALCSLALVPILLFGFVSFMNSWMSWHQYQGQPCHRSDFQVTRVYYQKTYRGGTDVYASGIVEGQREWMSLFRYLHPMPRNQAELESRVPPGTSIPIYLFPKLKGRLRVQRFNVVPTAESYRRAAMDTLKHGSLAAVLVAGLIFLLVRLRQICFIEPDPAFQQVAISQGS